MARKVKHEEHENHERWLVSYADFITLLFAFFVVMYSVSVVNEGRFRTVSESIQAALNPLVSTPASSMHLVDIGSHKPQLVPVLVKKAQFVRRLQEALGKFAKELHFQGQVLVTATDQGVLITIADWLMFESGRAEIKKEALPLLETISEVLVNSTAKEIRVLGHTDNVPVRSPLFASNWELSALRAVTVARVMSEMFHVPAKQVSATGLGEFRPTADNLTPENRGKNRRVELLVVMENTPDEVTP